MQTKKYIHRRCRHEQTIVKMRSPQPPWRFENASSAHRSPNKLKSCKVFITNCKTIDSLPWFLVVTVHLACIAPCILPYILRAFNTWNFNVCKTPWHTLHAECLATNVSAAKHCPNKCLCIHHPPTLSKFQWKGAIKNHNLWVCVCVRISQNEGPRNALTSNMNFPLCKSNLFCQKQMCFLVCIEWCGGGNYVSPLLFL